MLARVLICLALLIAPASAQQAATFAGMPFPPSAGGGGCSQATTFLARTSLTGSDVTNYTNLICGMVTDGLITGDLSTTGCGSLFDVLYIFATHDATTALLNICGTSFTGLNANSLTFTAYSGFTGDNVNSHFINTQFNPSTATSPDYTLNSAHTSVWNLTNIAESVSMVSDASLTGGNNIFPKFTDNNIYARINDSTSSSGFAIVDPRGHLLGNRSSSTARQLYQNASTTLNGGTVATYGSVTSGALPNSNLTALGSLGDLGSTRTAAMYSAGASLTATQVTNFYNRLRTYMTAVGVP